TSPLAGWLIAVKDNIDIAGMPTTAACPSVAATPEVDAPAVARLPAAAALVLGKPNLSQFATGLGGPRRPCGSRARHSARPVAGWPGRVRSRRARCRGPGRARPRRPQRHAERRAADASRLHPAV
ncbi:amidase family protein, partial [Clavibacter michiganensis]|uniref:amidase family protein n=1 Tax=Clavibacter michiganensis TaxID=28447 RepID=UPI00292EB5D7